MTDLIGTIADIVFNWNIEEKCDLCWEFTAPLRESDLNEYQMKGDPCCVLVAITDYRIQCLLPVNRATGLRLLDAEIHSFNLHVLAQSDIGLNVYNEIDGHPLSESKWATILQPLSECVACNPFEFCEPLGYEMEATNWTMNPRLDWMDQNYSGWTINVQLRRNNIG